MSTTNWLTATSKGVEECLEFESIHAFAIVDNCATVHPLIFDGLPLDPILHPGGVCLQSVHCCFAHPLIAATLTLGTLDQVLGTSHGHGLETGECADGARV